MERIQEDLHWKGEMVESCQRTDAFLGRLVEKYQDQPGRESTLALAREGLLQGALLVRMYELDMTELRRKRDSLDEEYRLHLLLNPEPLI